jgi:hypothetical protein
MFLRIDFGSLDPDPGGQKSSEKSQEISCFKVLDVAFLGLKTSPAAWTSFEGLGKAN